MFEFNINRALDEENEPVSGIAKIDQNLIGHKHFVMKAGENLS